MARIAWIVGVVFGAWAMVAEATEEGFSAVYDLYLSGLPLAELKFDAEVGASGYDVRSSVRTVSPLRLVYKADIAAETHGAVAAQGLTPERFKAFTKTAKKKQLVQMDYAGGALSAISADPEFRKKTYQVDPFKQTGALDPLSAALTAFAPAPIDELCPGLVDVFDGRRRYTVSFKAPVADTEFGDFRCEAMYTRVAGFKPKMMKRRTEFPLTVWFVTRPSGKSFIRRAAASTQFGDVIVLLRGD